jgi:hypothetical protein
MANRRPYWNNVSPLARLGIAAGFRTAADRAEALGCSRSHLLHCEIGSSLPGLDLIARMVTTYETTPETVEKALHDIIRRRNES